MAKRRNRGEGSVFQRPDGKWRAQVSHNGQRLSYKADNKAECIAWVQNIQTQIGFGWNLEGAKTLLKDYAAYWLDLVKSQLRIRTWQGYAAVIRNHINPYLGGIQLKDITPERIDQFYAKLETDHVGVYAIRLCHRTLHVMFEKAIKYNFMLRNPAHGAEVPRTPSTEMGVLDEEQVSRFLSAVRGTKYEALFLLAITTGMREGELFGLKWSDISWQRGVLYLRRQVQRVQGEGIKFFEPKTRAGKRTIKLGEGALQELREHKERQNLDRSLAGKRWREMDLIFTSKYGGTLDHSNVRREYNAILAAAGLTKIRFHDLRHTAASLMLNNGIPVIVVSKILGHSKPSVTLDVYGHLFNEMQDGAAKLMDQLTTFVSVELPISSPSEGTIAPRMHQTAPEEVFGS